MIERVRSKKPTIVIPADIFLKGKWIDGGNAFRVWYVSNGKIKVVNANGASSWEIDNAMRREAVLVQ
jgi:hypothetical protein